MEIWEFIIEKVFPFVFLAVILIMGILFGEFVILIGRLIGKT